MFIYTDIDNLVAVYINIVTGNVYVYFEKFIDT